MCSILHIRARSHCLPDADGMPHLVEDDALKRSIFFHRRDVVDVESPVSTTTKTREHCFCKSQLGQTSSSSHAAIQTTFLPTKAFQKPSLLCSHRLPVTIDRSIDLRLREMDIVPQGGLVLFSHYSGEADSGAVFPNSCGRGVSKEVTRTVDLVQGRGDAQLAGCSPVGVGAGAGDVSDDFRPSGICRGFNAATSEN